MIYITHSDGFLDDTAYFTIAGNKLSRVNKRAEEVDACGWTCESVMAQVNQKAWILVTEDFAKSRVHPLAAPGQVWRGPTGNFVYVMPVFDFSETIENRNKNNRLVLTGFNCDIFQRWASMGGESCGPLSPREMSNLLSRHQYTLTSKRVALV